MPINRVTLGAISPLFFMVLLINCCDTSLESGCKLGRSIRPARIPVRTNEQLLLDYAACGNLAGVQQLIKLGVDLNYRAPESICDTALWRAMRRLDTPLFQLLVRAGAREPDFAKTARLAQLAAEWLVEAREARESSRTLKLPEKATLISTVEAEVQAYHRYYADYANPSSAKST